MMETAEPVSYDFPGHSIGAIAPRRMMNSGVGHNFPFYTNPTTSFPLPFQQSSSPTYGFGHTLNNHHHHHHPPNNHHQGYQHFFITGHQHQLNSQPVRLSSEPPPAQLIPDIRPAKNAFNRVARDPSVKNDPDPALQKAQSLQSSVQGSAAQGKDSSSPNEAEFSTEVDNLMKAIQAKATDPQPSTIQSLPSLQHLTHGVANTLGQSYTIPQPQVTNPCTAVMFEEPASRSGKKRKYTCNLPHCGKNFAQKTHLDIHMRAHTGDKPFICNEPSCGQRFSQLGNLKTHQRRHTGEKPFSCDICQKRFAQRGNVRAHKITHQQAKPFTCLLDDCGKQFTQLGNLKSHQNKFHATALRDLTLKFSQITDGDMVTPQDRKLWEYFATLYKNSNKGIKGRGKDRRISPTSKSEPGSGSRKQFQHLDRLDGKTRRPSYEGSSACTGVSSSDEDEVEPYYLERQAH